MRLAILLALVCLCLLNQCVEIQDNPAPTFNGADTLKIMIVNDSIASIEPYRK